MDSLFEYVSSSVVNGVLPEGFSLPALTEDENEIIWADGALDGVTIYHMGAAELSKDDITLISDAVRAASRKDQDLADSLFKMLGIHLRAISAVDSMQSYIIDNQRSLDARNLLEYAMHLLFESDDRECVKFGLALIELFTTDDMTDLKETVRTIGLSDEFALFAIFVMLKWKDGNNEIWQLARKIRGWGRIHAVDRLEPDTEEIRKWLLLEGVHNTVMPAYSALTCWNKSNAGEILRNGPSREEFTGIRDIIDGLLDEGPVPGISEIPERDEMISAFLDFAGTMELSLDDYEVIHNIFFYYKEEYSDKCPAAMACRRLLHTYHCWCLVLDAVRQGRCIDMAADIGIDVRPYVLELMKTSLEKHYHLCGYLMDDIEYMNKTIDLYRQELPLEEMKTGPSATLGQGYEYWRQSALEFLFQELGDHPCEGQDLVETGLQSAPARTRNGALNVLESWVSAEQKSLPELAPGMSGLLSQLSEKEPDDNVRMRMKGLISMQSPQSR